MQSGVWCRLNILILISASLSLFAAGWNSIARGKNDSCHWKCHRSAGRHCTLSVNIILCGYVVEYCFLHAFCIIAWTSRESLIKPVAAPWNSVDAEYEAQ